MRKCPNCGTILGCSCQVRKFPNGKVGCTQCIHKPTPPPVTKEKTDK